jgi:hypothetical protein
VLFKISWVISHTFRAKEIYYVSGLINELIVFIVNHRLLTTNMSEKRGHTSCFDHFNSFTEAYSSRSGASE